jgi:hypothetical protein
MPKRRPRGCHRVEQVVDQTKSLVIGFPSSHAQTCTDEHVIALGGHFRSGVHE